MSARRPAKKKWLVAACLTFVVVLAAPAVSAADPGGPNLGQPVMLTCNDGSKVTVNTGTLTNQGRVAWVTTDDGVFVSATLSFSDGTQTFLIFDSKPGVQAHQTLVTCSGDAGGGFTVTSTGFITPHS